ncbi:hypothetical protein CEXT_743191 [Caerostris extrusa]|uniref:Uncharacterized protein n=1 Tax=Caerostris extrusa TaxID=172846 RepID=A0AAV4T0D4_CAEEX|nr:hypothetical protein CEXT_743191 [Caerostris extrusa]
MVYVSQTPKKKMELYIKCIHLYIKRVNLHPNYLKGLLFKQPQFPEYHFHSHKERPQTRQRFPCEKYFHCTIKKSCLALSGDEYACFMSVIMSRAICENKFQKCLFAVPLCLFPLLSHSADRATWR